MSDTNLWDDMLTDTLVYNSHASTDQYGNPVEVTAQEIPCYIISQTKRGGGESSSTQEQDSTWDIQVVTTDNQEYSPNSDEAIYVNGKEYSVVSVEQYEDLDIRAYVISAVINETTEEP